MTTGRATSGLFTRPQASSNLCTTGCRKEARLNKLLQDDQGRIRNGWWILLFIAVLVASQLAYRPVSHGLQSLGADKAWLSPLPVAFLLLVTWLCQRLRGQPLSAVGLRLDARWMRQALAGIALGGVLMLAVTTLIHLAGGVRYGLDPAHGMAALAQGAWLFLWAALLEELLFRGFVFQRLVDGTGALTAQLLMAALFALAHWGNPGMEGTTEVWATIDTMLGALLLGLAYLRTGSLALPIGIHFGWNWVQGSVLGFDVSGMDQSGWLLPHLLDKPQWLTGGAFGPEASVFSVLVDATAVFALWRWKGVRTRR
jgi:membrane protease YdiL (CAAX protease family)